jgi:hypothetical protein
MTISSLWRRKAEYIYTDEQRKLTLTTVAGDNTAGIHVENNMWLNIDFNSTAILSFDVTLYEVCVKRKRSQISKINSFFYRACK